MIRTLKFFNNLSIKLKFLFSFMLISSLILPISYLFVETAKKNNATFDILVNDTFPDIEYLLELKNVAIQIQLLTNGFILHAGESTKSEGSKPANLKLQLLALFSELDKWLELYISQSHPRDDEVLQKKIITENKDRILFSSLKIIESYESHLPETLIEQQRHVLFLSEENLKSYLANLIIRERNNLSIQKNNAEKSIETALKIAIIFIIFSILISLLLSLLLTKIISQPIIYLRDFTLSIKNFDRLENVKITSTDEIGELSLSINSMINNLFSFKEKNERLNLDMISIAHKAGMAEVATSILHNLGNILNSVKVSVDLLLERTSNNTSKNLNIILNLISTHKTTLAYYFTEDPKGKLLPDFLLQFLEEFVKSNKANQEELSRLHKLIKHIEDIVAMQKVISGATIILNEEVELATVIESALQMCEKPNAKFIMLQKNLDSNLKILSDQSKLLQILVNLIKNAYESLITYSDHILNSKISISLQIAADSNFIEIIISDNGIGIASDKIANIFSQGYTTKVRGHGFGLHSCALSAKELGGNLQVRSKGERQGATFILTLPFINPSKKG